MVGAGERTVSGRTVPVRAVGPIASAVRARAEAELAEQRTLADVLAWARAQSPPRAVAEIVTQDEYTIGRGWQPTPSRLRDGERVLGYAACAVTTAHRESTR